MASERPSKAISSPSKRPPLYRQPQAFRAELHGNWQLAQHRDFRFAARAGALPITAVEFLSAARNFPVVFAVDPPHSPLCFLGLDSDENLFVDAQGQWDSLSYIPAYVRRYPFLLLSDSAEPARAPLLALDGGYPFLGADQRGDRLLDAEGQPTAFLENALAFCTDFQRQWEISLAIAAALSQHGLLVPGNSRMTLPGERELVIQGFLTIDEQALNELPAELFVDWRDRGWLAPIYAVLAAQLNWTTLVQRRVNRRLENPKLDHPRPDNPKPDNLRRG